MIEITYVAISILMVVVGVLCFFFPDFMAGYNTLPKEKKATIDLPKLRRTILLSCLCLALLTWPFAFLPDAAMTHLAYLALMLVWLITTLILSNRKIKKAP